MYMRIQGFTRVYMGVHENIGVMTGEYRGLQEYSWVHIAIQGFTGVYMGVHEDKGVYRSIHGCT